MRITLALLVCLSPGRARLALMLIFVLVTGVCTPRAARGDPEAPPLPGSLPINVFVQDLAGVSSEELDDALDIVSRVYRRVGVEIRWFVGEDAVRTVPEHLNVAFCRSVYNISLLPAAAADTLKPRPPGNTLGLAAPGTRFARVLTHRVKTAALAANVDEGLVLGYVMAHEIGHLLLPAGSHSAGGLMSADLDFRRARQEALWFDAEQGEWIRRAVALRPATPI